MQRDHLGNEYKNIQLMLDEYGISKTTFHRRIKKMSLEEALTSDVKETHKACTDHLGNQFPTFKEMVEYWGKTEKLVAGRLKNNWELEKALTAPNRKDTCAVDHLGHKYDSVGDMCAAYGLDITVYRNRRKRNWTLEAALTTPMREIKLKNKNIQDHLGNHYSSYKKMADAYGIKPYLLERRLHNGEDIKSALTRPPDPPIKSKYTRDHTGRQFKSFSAMCKFYQMDYHLVDGRLRKGWTLEHALTCPKGATPAFRITDPYGQTFETRRDMCRAYNVSFNKYDNMLRGGRTLAEALGIIPDLHRPVKNLQGLPDTLVKKNIGKTGFFLCQKNGHEVVLSFDELAEILVAANRPKYITEEAI